MGWDLCTYIVPLYYLDRRRVGARSRFWYVPASLFKADVLEDPQLAAFEFEQIAHFERSLGVAQREPQRVRAGRFHHRSLLVVLRFDDSHADRMWRPAE